MSIEFLPEGGVTSPQGFLAGAARGGIKTQGDDVALITAENGATAAAVFTRNMVKAAPVWISARHAQSAITRAVVVNAGNANCCTGERGLSNARRMCELAAQKTGAAPQEVLVCSTGIIGHQLPMDKVENAIAAIELSRGDATNESTARAVMTTDIVPKFCAARATIGGQIVTVGGQAKGVGMIGPDMGALHATMLSFLTTDAKIEKGRLQRILETAVERSFNSVTVDGDTSTNDTCFLLASGTVDVEINDDNEAAFQALVNTVTEELAKKIARDGEGATKLVTIEVSGAPSEADAKRIAMTVANSPLVKTALFGGDPNWGRLAMAAGRAGVNFDPQKMQIRLGGIEVFRDGEPADFDLGQAEAALQSADLLIEIALGESDGFWRAWTCDFSYDYVKINAEYHT
jgi:glutamate N-acetyltransferase / amino-acid N-acetyltransferase